MERESWTSPVSHRPDPLKERIADLVQQRTESEKAGTMLWKMLPASIKLGDADDLATAIYSIISQLYEGKSLRDIANAP